MQLAASDQEKKGSQRMELKEKLVRSMCSGCQNGCGIVVRIDGGVVTQIIGDTENPRNSGRICAKGLSGMQGVYSPYRVKKPLIRTNPEKGLEIDPKWREATWDEALALIAEKLKKLREDDPRKIMFCSFDVAGGMQEYGIFMNAFGSPNFTPISADLFCGNSVHPMHYLNQASFEGGIDLKYCKYLLQMGTQWGSVINQQNTMHGTTELAEARAFSRTKVVVVDPWCSFAGSKADEWIPIRPGTDAAFILGLVDVIINEIGKYDEQYLKLKTNAPYLVCEDKTYLRDTTSRKPLVWDSIEGKAKPFDDETRIKYMDKFGVDMEILSVSSHLGPNEDYMKIAKITHDALADIVSKHPTRFAAVATLPKLEGEFLDELDRGITQLGLKGCFIYSNNFGKPIDSPEFLPFWEKMAKYNLPVLIHPTDAPYYPWIQEYNLNVVFGWPFDTTLALGRIVYGGLLEKFPTLKIIPHHLGGMVPFFSERIVGTSETRGLNERLKKPAIEYFKMLYGDSMVNGSMRALVCGLDFFGVDHVLFATDHPWGPGNGELWTEKTIKNVHALDISEGDKQKIFSENAKRLFKM